jgi:PAS domain S-box-containing protein
VVDDVTEKVQADRALRDSERRLALAQTAARLGVWDWDLLTNVHTVSGEYLQLYGLPADHPSPTHEEWLRLVHPHDRKRVQAALQESIERTHVWNTEFRVAWPDGSIHWLLGKGTVFLDDSGQPVRIAGVNLDITERKRAEEVRSHLAAIVESSDDAIISKTLDGKIVSWNPGAERIYGYTAEEMLGLPISLLVPPDRSCEIPELLGQLRRGESLKHYETTLVGKDGRRIEVSVTISPISDSTGAVVGASVIARDITEQKQAEAALRESEERFRNMADTAPVMIWISGADQGFTFFNKTWLDFTGRTMEQELGNGWAEGLHPDDLDRCVANYSSSFDARSSFRMEYRLRRADGEYRWVLDNGVPLYRGDQFTGYIGSCIDITEQKLAQDQLRTSERRLIEAQRLAQVGSWERHFEGDAIYWSDEMFRILGLPVGPPLHFLTFLNSVHPDDREKIREGNHKALSTAAPVIVEHRFTRPDGEMRFLRSFVEVIGSDPSAPVRMAGAIQDITEQVRARELLLESQERLTSAQRLAHVGNWDWDIKANRVFWSEELCRIFGRPPNYTADYAGFLQAVQPQERERVDRAIRDRLAGKKRPELEFQITRPDGDVRMVACISEVVRDAAGSPVRMSGACLDVTDQRRAEAAAQKSRDEMAHQNRVAALGELATSLAHELNQPLAAILLNSQAASRFLSGQPPNLARVADCLNNIAFDGERAGDVIKRLRGLLKKGESQPSLVDVNEVVSDTLRLVGHDALLRQVSVRFEPLPSLPPVLGDRIQLYQVVLNLILNGLDAVAERPAGDRWVLVRTAEADGGGVELTVEDSGKGITEGDLTRVFEPFLTTKRTGLGMGLSISRSIVEAHGGRIWAENNARHSAIFHCVLPVAQQAAVAATL